ncbi:hypothetical protein DYL59_11375 [Pseudomonas kairouanensis]|uniref:Uncharacterized protein n=1 Tax=Pseudomonas kairouanensis TaxID=2293832 RepID=A0A4Z0ART8_9PSED|nr:hypothetical protein DYL59_11375 [Pseudomonas kairouanensis]
MGCSLCYQFVSLNHLWRPTQKSVCNAVQCGSGLARESGVSASTCVSDTPLSRASPLPHGVRVHFN